MRPAPSISPPCARPPVPEAMAKRRLLKKAALVAAYSCFIAFGIAVMLILDDRPLDERGQTIIAVMAAGGFLASLSVLFFQKKFERFSPLKKFIAVFVFLYLMTLALQGALTGGLFYLTTFITHEPFTTADGWLQLAFTSASGFAYFYVFGFDPFWPVMAAAGLLFSLGFLTLGSGLDTTYPQRSTR